MSTDFTDRAPLLRDPQLLQPIRPAQSDQWPMIPTAIASAFAFFLLGAFILFACNRFANTTTASPPSAWQHNQHVPPPPQPVALCPETVAALPVVRAGRAGQKFYSCAVCLAEYEEKERVKLMPVCGHVFHPECIDTWLLSHGSCPICRCSDMSVRLNVFECVGEEEEENLRLITQRNIGRSRSCSSSSMEVEGTMLFMHRSCSF